MTISSCSLLGLYRNLFWCTLAQRGIPLNLLLCLISEGFELGQVYRLEDRKNLLFFVLGYRQRLSSYGWMNLSQKLLWALSIALCTRSDSLTKVAPFKRISAKPYSMISKTQTTILLNQILSMCTCLYQLAGFVHSVWNCRLCECSHHLLPT